jgi:hypothetical protein
MDHADGLLCAAVGVALRGVRPLLVDKVYHRGASRNLCPRTAQRSELGAATCAA